MKLICLPLSLVAVTIVSACLFAAEPKVFDLDGREVVVRVYRNNNMVGDYEQTTAIVKGRTIKVDLEDPNESTSFRLHTSDQKDAVIRQYLDNGSRGWAYTRLGLEYYFPFSNAECDSRQVVLRIYKDDADDVCEYSREVLRTVGRELHCDLGELGYPAFLVVCGQDQQDSFIRHILGNSIHGQAYKKGMEVRVPYRPVDTEDKYRWEFYDAVGNAISGGQVEVYFKSRYRKFKLGAWGLDSNGRMTLPFCVAGNNCKIGSNFYPSTYCRFSFIVSTGQYNTCIIEPGGCIKSGPLYLPSVLPDSEAYERSVWGQVVDGNDNPVAGALVKPAGCTPPGAKWIGSRLYQRNWVVADLQGRFRAYLPVDESAYQIGTLIPAGSEYHLRVEPPAGSGLEPFRGRVVCGKGAKIKLDRPGYFHTFAFEGQNGPITDVKLLKRVEIKIVKPGQNNDIWMRFDPCQSSYKLPCGKYVASCDPPQGIVFDPIEVTPDSPKQLVFKPIPAKVYRGRVVDGVTGKAIADAEITALGRRVTRTRTDQAGIFEIKSQPGRSLRMLTASKKDYTKFRIIKSSAKQDAAGTYLLPESRLFPAATVTVKPAHGNWTEQAYFRPQWFVLGSDLPPWAKYLQSVAYEHPQDAVWREYEVRANRQESFPVPAGVRLRIQLRALHDVEWAPVTIADDVRLAQGEVFDVGEVQILPPFAVFVEVLDSAGRAVEGVPVIASGQHDPAVSSSDEQGIAVFEFVGYSKGEFIVKYDPEDDANQPVLHRSIPYEVAGVEDANSSYAIRVPDRLLNQILK